MKKIILLGIVICLAGMAQAQIRFGFSNPLAYDNWNNNDTSAGVELVVWTPNNDTLTIQVGADITAIDGNARNGIEYNFPPMKWLFQPGTNIYDSTNKKVIKYNLPPNTTFFGERDFYIKLTNLVGITSTDLLNNRDMIRVIIDYDGTNVGIKKLDVHSYRLYPIPTSSSLFIEGANPETFTVFDLSGRKALEGEVMQSRIDVAALSPGLYVLHAQTQDGLIVQKFLKQ
jgi:hypothetical protein